MGVAIGVSIDEGIAKEIQGTLNRSGCSLDAVVTKAAESLPVGKKMRRIVVNPGSEGDIAEIHIGWLGFVALPGDGDPTVAEVKGAIREGDRDFILAQRSSSEAAVPLNTLRTDGTSGCRLLQATLVEALQEWHHRKAAE